MTTVVKFSEFRSLLGKNTGHIVKASEAIIATGITPVSNTSNTKLSTRRTVLVSNASNGILPGTPKVRLETKDISLANAVTVGSWGELVQSNTAKRPVYYTSGGFLGASYVSFARASSQFMHTPDVSPITMNCSTNGGFTMCALVKFKDPLLAWERLFHAELSTDTSSNFAYTSRDNATSNLQVKYGAATVSTTVANTIVQNQWAVYALRVTPTSLQLFKNNVEILSAAGATLSNNTLHIGLCANISGGLPSAATAGLLNADIAGFYMYDRALNNIELSQLYAYLLNGRAQITQILSPGNYVFPPRSLPTATTNVTGQAYGNGSYTVTASSQDFGSALLAFDKVFQEPNYWCSAARYPSTVYNNAVSTTDSGGTLHYGEWIQIVMPVAIRLDYYTISIQAYDTHSVNEPKTWVVLGSNDGTTWYVVDTQTNIVFPATRGLKTQFNITNNTKLFSRYRFVCKAVLRNTSVAMSEWVLGTNII